MHSLTFKVLIITFGVRSAFTIETKECIWEQLAIGRFCLVNMVGLNAAKAIVKPNQLEASMFYPAQICM